MTRKNLSLLALACAGLFAMPGVASACQTSAWDIPGTAVAGGPPTTARYSGLCAAKSTAAGQFVTDESPGAEPKYFVQFYLFTGVTSASDVRVFAADGAAPNVITVDYNQAAGQFKFNGAGATVTGIVQNRWYMIRMAWDKQTAQSMVINVQGNNSSNEAAGSPATINGITTGQIDTAKLGWITGTGTGSIITDAFVSQRATPPVRLLRGDATGTNGVGFADASAAVSEFLNGTLAQGQPDCTEDGTVGFSDASCAVSLFLNGGD